MVPRAIASEPGAKMRAAPGTGLQHAAFVRFGRHHAIEIDQQNQAAVGSDRCAGKEFYAAKIFAEALDDDFVFAEDFFDDEADLAIAGVGDDHAEVTVDRFERGQTEIRIESHDFGDDIANLRKELAADIFDFVGTDAADFFDDCERKRKARATAADKERGRDDQRQRNFERELRAGTGRALNFDFAVECVEIGADHVKTHAAAG